VSGKHISKSLRAVAYLWMSFPAAYLLYALVVMKVSGTGLLKLLLSPSYWIISAFAVVAGYGLRRLRWYAWYMFVFSNITITYQTAVATVHYSESDLKFITWFTTAVLQLIALVFVSAKVRVPYFFPRIRWWESDPRYKLSVQAKMIKDDKSEIEGEIMDLSLGGCFVKTHHYFIPDEFIKLDLVLFDEPITCSGRVVWRTESTVTHPKGIGIKFEGIPKETSLILKEATKRLRKLARTYAQMTRERNWQEYLQREQRYQGRFDPRSGAAVPTIEDDSSDDES